MKKLGSIAVLGSIAFVLLAFSGRLDPLFSADYLPHRYCYLAKPGLVWTNVLTDGLIALSYALIFCCLLWIANRLRQTPTFRPYLWILVAFAVFIVACGATHLMDVVTVWLPVYPLAAAFKVVCALTSIPTAVLFALATPRLASGLINFLRSERQLQAANLELRELSARDALTHLNNRRHFEDVLATEWQRSTRCACPLAVLMMDIDHFKLLNDHYGHLAGDDCLTRVGLALLSRPWRAEDLIARYGGEEFALLLPGSDLRAAEAIAEQLRQTVLDLQIENKNSPVAQIVTMSIGVASVVPVHGDDARELLAAADSALYQAKRNGRNRVESAESASCGEPVLLSSSSLDELDRGIGLLERA
jgi:diguanylate cyclase (GGDEF)-like protein